MIIQEDGRKEIDNFKKIYWEGEKTILKEWDKT